MTVNRITLGLLSATLIVAACTGGAPGTSPRTGGSPAVPGGDAALTQLCGTDTASLSGVATEIEGMDATTDTTTLSTSIGTAISNLDNVNVDTNVQPARDAAVTALQQLQAGLADPAPREQLAGPAATALRSLETQLCM
ncbi:MAG: hypothetical protein H0V12_01150 [Chloroflexi bacterium]|nr:hypothetical protein [Chloroflexota bacterium]